METVTVTLHGHLTRGDLEQALAPVNGDGVLLVVDCRKMTGYDLDTRHAFIAWNRTMRGHVRRVAVVTENVLWHMVVATMALAAGQQIRAFKESAEATAWLQTP